MITSCVISTTEDEHEDELNLFKSQTRGATCGAELTSNVRPDIGVGCGTRG